jgi:hypothetical protein
MQTNLPTTISEWDKYCKCHYKAILVQKGHLKGIIGDSYYV